MEHKELGNTGVTLPEIGIGTWEYRGGVEPIRRGVAQGAFLIDTAEMYRTEDVVGKAVQDMRQEVLLATKVWPNNFRYRDALKAADNSLKKLGTDYIDLYQLHWPNPDVPIEETMGAMDELVDSGKVRFIGVSNFSVEQFKAAQAASKHKIVSNQVKYSLVDRGIESDLLPYCQENHITVIAYSPLSRNPSRLDSQLGGALECVGTAMGKSEAQVALNWCTSKDRVIAIPKSNSAERVEENCRASGWRIPSEYMAMLENASLASARR